MPSITRKTSTGLPRYEDAASSDVFVLSGAEDLVPLLSQSGSDWVPDSSTVTVGTSSFIVPAYRPRVEAGFARIERWQDTATGDVHWRTVTKDNVTSLYGQDAASRIADPADPSRVFSWLLDLSFDDRGNAISYVYKPEDSANVPRHRERGGPPGRRQPLPQTDPLRQRHPLPACGQAPACPPSGASRSSSTTASTTRPTRNPAESAAWPCRPDPFSTYRSGFEVRTYRTVPPLPDVSSVWPSSAPTPCWCAPPTSPTAQKAPVRILRCRATPALLGHADRMGAPGRRQRV